MYVFHPEETEIAVDYLWKIPLVAAASIVPAAVLYTKKEPTRRQLIIREIVHIVSTAAIVIGLLMLFGWMELRYLPGFVIFFVAVFLLVTWVAYGYEQRLAGKINEKLKQNAKKSDGDDDKAE
jgi:uncharacterized membrane protein